MYIQEINHWETFCCIVSIKGDICTDKILIIGGHLVVL